jgi:hypothetical protein
MDLSRRVPGELLEGAGLVEARPEAFIKPLVICVSRDAERARFLGHRLAGKLRQDVRHRQAQLFAHFAQEPFPARLPSDSDELVERGDLFGCHSHLYCPSLFSGGRPPAVARLIVTIVVLPINGQLSRPRPHVGEEIDERIAPTVANGDSASPVAMEPGGFWIEAPGLHPGPDGVGPLVSNHVL